MNLSKHMNDGLKRSLRVLRAVKVTTGRDNVWVGTYLNGRENGLRINVFGKDWESTRTFVIAENRNSDAMVLYTGKREEFGFDAIPNENTYKGAQYFNSEKELVAMLTKAIKTALKSEAIKEAA
jgi:hypothetical protein